jgi:hypothetical protein
MRFWLKHLGDSFLDLISLALALLAKTARLVGSDHNTINSSASNVTAMTTVTRITRVSPTDLNMTLVPLVRDFLRAFIDKFAQIDTGAALSGGNECTQKGAKGARCMDVQSIGSRSDRRLLILRTNNMRSSARSLRGTCR